MIEHSTSVDVIVNGLENNPYCFHGPTLLFKKIGLNSKEYFACSACRDRKDCNFYEKFSDKDFKSQKRKWETIHEDVIATVKNEKRHENYLKILNSSKGNKSSNAGYCYDCNILFKNSDHEDHKIIKNLTGYQLKHPTEILIPKDDNKTEAQYFFRNEIVKTIVTSIKKMGVKRILCIGTPRIHEYVLNECKGKIKSLLLDIDRNYYNFYGSKEFIWFNMFNSYIFDKDSRSHLLDFLKVGRIVVLMDPPFGGRVEPLAYTLAALNKDYAQINNLKNDDSMQLQVLWFFPYFMERHITSSLPDFKMLDFKIDYDNHSSFTNVGNRKRKYGSPVRIFTNVPLHQFDLSDTPGYKFCTDCNFWVAEENRHCFKCEACTSKNGTTYTHCDKCRKCVKPSYEHCDTCSRCCLRTHVCGEFQPDQNCYHCHQPGHKKYDCPGIKKRKLETLTRKSKKGKKLGRKKKRV